MTDKILIITPPDDILLDGIRILHVDLTDEQSQLVSSALLSFNIQNTIINYVWKINNPIDWLFDKKIKSDLIFFNADSINQTIVGYLSAHSKSYYFGNLKDLQLTNNSAIYSVNDILTLLEKVSKNYE